MKPSLFPKVQACLNKEHYFDKKRQGWRKKARIEICICSERAETPFRGCRISRGETLASSSIRLFHEHSPRDRNMYGVGAASDNWVSGKNRNKLNGCSALEKFALRKPAILAGKEMPSKWGSCAVGRMRNKKESIPLFSPLLLVVGKYGSEKYFAFSSWRVMFSLWGKKCSIVGRGWGGGGSRAIFSSQSVQCLFPGEVLLWSFFLRKYAAISSLSFLIAPLGATNLLQPVGSAPCFHCDYLLSRW